ncbi:MAG TPA: nitroreductase/quinone reductase family protein [Solirubrobacterales bacterium]|jgi:deazaflavin-dependent oxidoreductase (nitroreductase family)
MTRRDKARRALARFIWRLFNPLARALAGVAPWWVVLETTGRRSGRPRQAPLATGPVDGNVAWLLAVHGEHSAFARNIAADPRVRLRLRGRWYEGTARLEPLDDEIVTRFNAYARSGPRAIGIEPRLVRIELDRAPSASVRGAAPG